MTNMIWLNSSEILRSNVYDVQTFTDPISAFQNVKYSPTDYSLLINDYHINKLNDYDLNLLILNERKILLKSYQNKVQHKI